MLLLFIYAIQLFLFVYLMASIRRITGKCSLHFEFPWDFFEGRRNQREIVSTLMAQTCMKLDFSV